MSIPANNRPKHIRQHLENLERFFGTDEWQWGDGEPFDAQAALKSLRLYLDRLERPDEPLEADEDTPFTGHEHISEGAYYIRLLHGDTICRYLRFTKNEAGESSGYYVMHYGRRIPVTTTPSGFRERMPDNEPIAWRETEPPTT